MIEAAPPIAGPTLAPTNIAAENKAAAAAAKLFEMLENMMISFQFKPWFASLRRYPLLCTAHASFTFML